MTGFQTDAMQRRFYQSFLEHHADPRPVEDVLGDIDDGPIQTCTRCRKQRKIFRYDVSQGEAQPFCRSCFVHENKCLGVTGVLGCNAFVGTSDRCFSCRELKGFVKDHELETLEEIEEKLEDLMEEKGQ